jgi:hypothetical protein
VWDAEASSVQHQEKADFLTRETKRANDFDYHYLNYVSTSPHSY